MKRTKYGASISLPIVAVLVLVATSARAEEHQYFDIVEPQQPDFAESPSDQAEPMATGLAPNLWDEDSLWFDDFGTKSGDCSESDLLDLAPSSGTSYRWLVRADAMFLDRSTADGEQSLAFGDPLNPKGTEVLHTGQLAFPVGWGPRISLIGCASDCRSLEVNYFMVDSWLSTAARTGNISVQFPSFAHPPLPPGPIGDASFSYSSQMHSFEAILRQVSQACWLTWTVGFRYVELTEEFGAIFNTGGGVSRYSIDTANHMYGVQFGGEAHIWQCCDLSVDGWAKAAVMGNVGNQSTFEDVAAIGGGTATASAHGNQTAFLGELGVSATYQISCRLSARAGYQLLWFNRVALAPEQLDNTNPSIPMATLDLTGDLFLHGGFVGLEATF
jgi:hypothetical protein